MIYVDEYSIPYVLGENDIDYKGDFVFMGYYVTNMEDKENCYECESDAGTDITSAEHILRINYRREKWKNICWF